MIQAKSDAAAVVTRQQKEWRKTVVDKQDPKIKRNLEQLAEPGASSWLGAIPRKDQGFNLSQGEFIDAVRLRYDMRLKNLPSKCACNQPFTVEHAINCHRGGFVNASHDSIRNFEAGLLSKVCHDVQIEPPLQPVGNMRFKPSANTKDDARLDVRAKGFWREGQNAFFDVKVTNADTL